MMSSGESFRIAAFVRRVVGPCGFEIRVKKQSLVFAVALAWTRDCFSVCLLQESPGYSFSSGTSLNFSAGTLHSGQRSGAVSPSWVYPHTEHTNFFMIG